MFHMETIKNTELLVFHDDKIQETVNHRHISPFFSPHPCCPPRVPGRDHGVHHQPPCEGMGHLRRATGGATPWRHSYGIRMVNYG